MATLPIPKQGIFNIQLAFFGNFPPLHPPPTLSHFNVTNVLSDISNIFFILHRPVNRIVTKLHLILLFLPINSTDKNERAVTSQVRRAPRARTPEANRILDRWDPKDNSAIAKLSNMNYGALK